MFNLYIYKYIKLVHIDDEKINNLYYNINSKKMEFRLKETKDNVFVRADAGRHKKEGAITLNAEPKYIKVVEWIKNQIENREFMPGDKIPSENDLGVRFHLSRQTIRHAISVLEEEGILTRLQGSGTYISDNCFTNIEKRTRIAVITTYVDSYIFPKTIQGIEQILSENGYTMELSFTNNTVEREKEILEDILEKDDIAGMIIEPTKSGLPNPNEDLYLRFLEKKVPIIFINSFYPGLEIPHVSMNDKNAAAKAVETLIHAGHKRIAAILKMDDGQGHRRYSGYMSAMKKAGLPTRDENVIWIDTEDVLHPELYCDKLLRRLEGCTAVFCYNDQVAFSLIELLRKKGVSIPGQMSVVSVDDSELAKLGDIKLSSIPHPLEKLGAKAALNLLQMMRDSKFDGTFEFEEEVILRESVASCQTE